MEASELKRSEVYRHKESGELVRLVGDADPSPDCAQHFVVVIDPDRSVWCIAADVLPAPMWLDEVLVAVQWSA